MRLVDIKTMLLSRLLYSVALKEINRRAKIRVHRRTYAAWLRGGGVLKHRSATPKIRRSTAPDYTEYVHKLVNTSSRHLSCGVIVHQAPKARKRNTNGGKPIG